ncbi:10058_t:CDS:2 [Diversispora eburnea]|uniref:10058_t:CDS:1 n=1 Tax=Diversispora eburnea TaxID=1213867 RepID=A0A9N9FV39_9GLOM|nr:10058_t:CDS:2 [Diversispora eburnea]
MVPWCKTINIELKRYPSGFYSRTTKRKYNASELSPDQLSKLREKYDNSQKILTTQENLSRDIKGWKDVHNDFTSELQKE